MSVDIYKSEKKSNFGFRQLIDPIGIFGGKPIWDTSSDNPTFAQRQAQADQQRLENEMRMQAEREASMMRADDIRRQFKQGERSAKLKTGLIVGGVLVAVVLLGSFVAMKIIKKK
jgi:hypothetical protein